MVKIYSDASLSKYAGYKIGSWCSIINNGEKILLQGRRITKEADINKLEYEASVKGISFATEILQIEPKKLMVFIDNQNAYDMLRKSKFNVEIKFIGGKKINEIEDEEKFYYNLCDWISGRITSDLVEKIKRQSYRIDEEKVGVIKAIDDIVKFLEEEIEPIVAEKVKTIKPKHKEEIDKDLDILLEKSINEYMSSKRILAIIKTTSFYLSGREIIQNVKSKKVKKIKEKILCV